MEVRLINYTKDAVDTLLYTKSTRLELGKETENKIKAMSEEEKMAELDYMSKTVPSSWEFVDYIFEIRGVSRAFTHQFVRTRTGSYAQQTMRMLNMENFDYVKNYTFGGNGLASQIYDKTMADINEAYKKMIELGIPEEDARGVLPTNICTNIIAKFNLRTLSELAKSRTGYRTQNEYRQVFDEMIKRVVEVHPWAEKFLISHKTEAAIGMDKFINGVLEKGAVTKDEAVAARKLLDILRKE